MGDGVPLLGQHALRCRTGQTSQQPENKLVNTIVISGKNLLANEDGKCQNARSFITHCKYHRLADTSSTITKIQNFKSL